jgi:Predicted membrane protein (DUF2157)
MKRTELDALLSPHSLAVPEIEHALTLSGSRPGAAEWRAFASRALGMAGVAAVGAGIIFFIAANWQAMGVMGHFALLEAALLMCVAIAWWSAGRANVLPAALILATLVTGALLALFGQTYQTGADVYELFLMWALLTLPFALAGMSGAVWAVSLCVLNVALALMSGWHGPGDAVWGLFDRFGLDKPTALMLPFAVNLAGAAIAYGVMQGAPARFAKAAPQWLTRLLLTFAFVFATVACVLAIVPAMWWHHGQPELKIDAGVLFTWAAVCVALAAFSLRQKRDVFPLALIAASVIVVSTTWVGKHLVAHEIGGAFVIALWLIGTSTTAGFLLMRYVRAWHVHAPAQAAAHAPAGA